MDPHTEVFSDGDELTTAVASALVDRLTGIQAEGRSPRLVLTGGSVAADLHRRLAAAGGGDVDWSRVEFWFGDERYVDSDSPDRNALQARETLLDQVLADPALVHEMPSSDSGRSLDDAARDYAAALPESPYDVVMLGVGPDGHCASLFPGQPQVHADGPVVGVAESPKPPPARLSLTIPELSRAREVWFVVSGAEKRDAVRRALAPDAVPAQVPASGPRGLEATRWWLDADAAGSGPR